MGDKAMQTLEPILGATCRHIVVALIAVFIGCDSSKTADEPSQQKNQEPVLTPELRERVQGELDSAADRTLTFGISPEASGDPVGRELEDALEPFYYITDSAFPDSLLEMYQAGDKPPARVVRLIEEHEADLNGLREVLEADVYAPTNILGPEFGDRETRAIFKAVKLLVGAGILAGPDACLDYAVDAAKLAEARGWGAGYAGALLTVGAGAYPVETAMACGPKASAEARREASDAFLDVLTAHPSPATIVDFEWLASMQMASGGEADLGDIDPKDAREATEHRLETLPRLRDVTTPPTRQIGEVRRLLAPQTVTINGILASDRQHYDRVMEKDQRHRRRLRKLVDQLMLPKNAKE
jgi:hypothetical protein